MNDAKKAITHEAAAIEEQAVTLDSVAQLLKVLEGHADTPAAIAGALRLAYVALDDATDKLAGSAAAIDAAMRGAGTDAA